MKPGRMLARAHKYRNAVSRSKSVGIVPVSELEPRFLRNSDRVTVRRSLRVRTEAQRERGRGDSVRWGHAAYMQEQNPQLIDVCQQAELRWDRAGERVMI